MYTGLFLNRSPCQVKTLTVMTLRHFFFFLLFGYSSFQVNKFIAREQGGGLCQRP